MENGQLVGESPRLFETEPGQVGLDGHGVGVVVREGPLLEQLERGAEPQGQGVSPAARVDLLDEAAPGDGLAEEARLFRVAAAGGIIQGHLAEIGIFDRPPGLARGPVIGDPEEPGVEAEIGVRRRLPSRRGYAARPREQAEIVPSRLGHIPSPPPRCGPASG